MAADPGPAVAIGDPAWPLGHGHRKWRFHALGLDDLPSKCRANRKSRLAMRFGPFHAKCAKVCPGDRRGQFYPGPHRDLHQPPDYRAGFLVMLQTLQDRPVGWKTCPMTNGGAS